MAYTNKNRSWRPRFSLRTFLVFVALVCAYIASWMATDQHGIAAGAYQYSPIPFAIVNVGPPRFSTRNSLTMEQDLSYRFWFFGKQHEMLERIVVKRWHGKSKREEREIVKQMVRERIQIKLDRRKHSIGLSGGN